jgi:hypothetical protein
LDVRPIHLGFVDQLAGGAATQQLGLVFRPEQDVGVVIAHVSTFSDLSVRAEGLTTRKPAKGALLDEKSTP